MKRYRLEVPLVGRFYYIWEFAEEASKEGGRFNGPDMRLTLQLISRGAYVPAEVIDAVDAFYDYWKTGETREFNIAEYVTSGDGMNYISGREYAKKEAQKAQTIDAFIESAPENARVLLRNAYETGTDFVKKMAVNEEQHDGSGYITWINDSIDQQTEELLATLKNALDNNITIPESDDNEPRLQTTYDRLIANLKKERISGWHYSIEDEDVRETQRAWLPYREAMIAFFAVVRPEIPSDDVKRWITAERIKNLETLLKSWERAREP